VVFAIQKFLTCAGLYGHPVCMWPEQAIIEWSRRVISIVACCRGAKLCAHAAQDFRSQHYYLLNDVWVCWFLTDIISVQYGRSTLHNLESNGVSLLWSVDSLILRIGISLFCYVTKVEDAHDSMISKKCFHCSTNT